MTWWWSDFCLGGADSHWPLAVAAPSAPRDGVGRAIPCYVGPPGEPRHGRAPWPRGPEDGRRRPAVSDLGICHGSLGAPDADGAGVVLDGRGPAMLGLADSVRQAVVADISGLGTAPMALAVTLVVGAIWTALAIGEAGKRCVGEGR